MGSGERKNKNSNDTNNKSRNNNNGDVDGDASLSDDYSDYSETETTTTTIDERILKQRRSSRRDISTSSTELDRVGTSHSRRRIKRGDSARRHSEPRDQRGKPPLGKKTTLKHADRNDPCRRTFKCVNASGCKYVDLNYSIAKTKAAKEAAKAEAKAEAKAAQEIARNNTMPPHTDKDYGGSKRHNHSSRDKSSIERRPSQKKSEKEKKKDKSSKEDKESKSRGGDKEKVVTPNCPLCTKPFKSPIVLTCAHTFCKSCVTVLVEAGDGASYQCPVCLSISSLTGSDEELFCPNFVILQMLEKESSVESYVCSVCDHANEAKHYCKECSDLLCHVCYDAHQVVKYTKDHNVSKLSSSVDLSKLIKKKYHCIQHENEKLGMYCTSCCESICRECAFAYHTGSQHKCISVEEASSTNRDIMKRKLFDIKSRTPKFQLMLLDIKRLKGLLRTQVKSVRAGISTSINTLINSLKDKEKELYKSADKIFGDKLKKLKEQKDGLERELEKHEALGRMLIQLDKHDNDVEMLQMNEAINKSLEMLDKPPKTNIKFDKHTFLLRSNEVNLAKEIGKHGEIYCANKTTGEISLVEPDEDDVELTPRKKSAVGRLKKTAQGEDSIIMFSELEDGILPTGSDSSMFDGVLQDMDVVKAKALKARANWLLLRSHLPGIVRFGKKAGLIKKESKHKFFPDARSSAMNKNTRNKAKKLKAKANWLLTRARLKQIVQQKHPPKTPVEYRNTREKQSVLQILQSGSKYSKKLTRATAIKARARANWLLVRSRLSNIIAYGRITGVLQFKPQSLPLTPLAYRRKREEKIMASIMHLRAIISRARANWLLVKSRLKDIAKYQRKSPKVNKKPTWRVYRQQLYNTRQNARKNIAESGSVRAKANWLILKTLIPDIILLGKYRESFADTRQKKDDELRYKKKNPNVLDNWETLVNENTDRSNSKRSTKEPLNNWDQLMNEKNSRNSKRIENSPHSRKENGTRESFDNWDQLMNEKNSRNNSKRYDKSPHSKRDNDHDESFDNWDQLMNEKNSRNSRRYDCKKQNGHDESFDNWDSLMKTHSGSNKERESSKNWNTIMNSNALNDKESRQNWDLIMNQRNSPKIEQLDSYQLWDLLILKTETKYDKRSKTSFEPQSSSQTETETEAENVNIQRKIESFKNWDKVSSATPSHHPNHWKTLIHNTPCGDDVTDEYLNTTDEIEEYETYCKKITTPPDEKKPRSIPEIIKNWRILIGGTVVARTSHSSLTKRVSFNRNDMAYAVSDWHRLIHGTPTNDALRHWNALCSKETRGSSRKDKSDELANWDKLAVTRYSSKRSNAENQKSSKSNKEKVQELDNWDMLMGSDTPKGKPKAAKQGDIENWDRLMGSDAPKEKLKATKKGDLENWDRLMGSDAPKDKLKATRKGDIENWDRLMGSDARKDKLKATKKGDLENWDRLMGSGAPKDKLKATKKDDLENWDRLTNTKYGDKQDVDSRGRKKPRPRSLDLENWDVLTNAKYSDKSPTRSSRKDIRAKSIDLENWDKLVQTKRSDKYDENSEGRNRKIRAKSVDLDNWDKLVNTKYENENNMSKGGKIASKKDLENWGRIARGEQYEDDTESPKKKQPSKADFDNWDKLTKQTKNNPFSNVRPDILTNWDRLLCPTLKSNLNNKIQSSPLTKSKSVDGLDNWDRLVDKQNTAADALSSSAKRKAYDNWYIITRDREYDDKTSIKRWHDLQGHKEETSDISDNGDDTDETRVQQQKQQKTSNKKAKENNKGVSAKAENEAVENWGKLIEGAIHKKPRKASSSSSSGKEKINKRGNKGTKPKKVKYASSSTSLNDDDDEEEEDSEEDSEEDMEAITNWNILIKGNDAFTDWDTLISGHIKIEDEDDQSSMSEIVKYTTKNEKVKLGHFDNNEEDSEKTNAKLHSLIEREQALLAWDILVEGKIVRSQKEIEEASSYWRHLESNQSSIPSSSSTATPVVTQKNSFKKPEKANSNWKSLLKGNKKELFEPYDFNIPPNVQTLFEKPPLEIGSEVSTSAAPSISTATTPKKEFPEYDSQFLSMNVKTSKGDFQNVKLQLTSPDKSILSAHIAENGDGTFTIFCCPRIDDDFNMFVSLQGSAFKNDVQVLNLYGSFAGLKSRERELACKTINLIRWHLTPGLLRKKGDKIFPISTGLT